MAPDGVATDGVDSLVGFARTLRAAGVAASPDRVQAAVRAVSALDPGGLTDVYWAGRLTLCATLEELPRYDQAFRAYFGGRSGQPVRPQRPPTSAIRVVAGARTADEADADSGAAEQSGSAAASAVEQLRHRDVTALTAAQRAELRRLLARLQMSGEQRRTRRRRPAARGDLDPARTVRATLRAGGEPARPLRRRSTSQPRRVVLLLDVSGSMDGYADALLRFAHAAAGRGPQTAARRGPQTAARRGHSPTEVFALGTRLTRLTREIAHADPDRAMTAVASALPDAGGGTRLGLLLKEFLDNWGQRGTARGAVVVILSDGWERGDAALLGRQVERLHRLAHRVIWANPRKAAPGFAPLAAGMAAALPHIDAFVEGHSLAALEKLADVVGGARGA